MPSESNAQVENRNESYEPNRDLADGEHGSRFRFIGNPLCGHLYGSCCHCWSVDDVDNHISHAWERHWILEADFARDSCWDVWDARDSGLARVPIFRKPLSLVAGRTPAWSFVPVDVECSKIARVTLSTVFWLTRKDAFRLHQGLRYLFPSQQQQVLFIADPAKYAVNRATNAR
jgi:hypothetical protein